MEIIAVSQLSYSYVPFSPLLNLSVLFFGIPQMPTRTKWLIPQISINYVNSYLDENSTTKTNRLQKRS